MPHRTPALPAALDRRSLLRAGAACLGLATAAQLLGCGIAFAADEEQPADEIPVRVVALKGPTAMGLVELMDQVDSGALDAPYSFEIVASPDEVAPLVAKADVDVAFVPANLASVLYNNTDGAVRAIAINTLGVLYLCTTGEAVENIADLAGTTIYASGKGATPEYALDYILRANGLDPESDVTIEWKSEHAECVAALAQDANAWALLPQPFVTTAQAKNPDIAVVFDLTQEWDKLQEDLPEEERSSLITGVTITRTAFIEEHAGAVDLFIERCKESADWVNANVEEAAQLVGTYDIVPAEVAQKAIPACSIVCVSGEQMQRDLAGYLGVLFEQNPKAVGGKLPGDEFYYVGPSATDAEDSAAQKPAE